MIEKQLEEINNSLKVYKTNLELTIKHIPILYSDRKAVLKSIIRNLISIQKAWQLKSGKWHDYDSSGNIIEVEAPREKDIKENQKKNKKSYNEEKKRLYNEMKEPSTIKNIKQKEYEKIKPELKKLHDKFLDKIKDYKIDKRDEEDNKNIEIGKKLANAALNNESFETTYMNGKEKIGYDSTDHTFSGLGYFPADLIPYEMKYLIEEKIEKSPEIEKEEIKAKQEYQNHLKKLTPKKEVWQLTKDEANTPITYNDMQFVTNYNKQIDYAENNKTEWLFRGWNGEEKIKTFNNAKEAKNYAENNDGDVYVLGEERDFYRSGQPPESGRSYNHMENRPEKGVSVYVTPMPGSMAGSNITHYGKGRQIDTGGDDEPVIIITKRWKEYKGHKKAVEEAIKQGKRIPEDVLKDYPDLKNKYNKND